MIYNATLIAKSDIRSPDYNLDKPKTHNPSGGVIAFSALIIAFILIVAVIFSGYDGSIRNCCGKRKSAEEEDDLDAAERGKWEMSETPGQRIRRLGVEEELRNYDIDEYLASETPRGRASPRPSSDFQEVDLGDQRGPSPALPRDMVAHHGSVQPLHRDPTGKEDWPLHQSAWYSRTPKTMTPKERLLERMNGERVKERMNGDRWA